MSETAPKTELMRSLGKLVRGLSALFWGLPVTLVLCVQTANSGWLNSNEIYGLVPQLAATALLAYGLWLMSDFQRQERVWTAALDRAKLASLINVGLSPFLHWHQRMPDEPLFSWMILAMAVNGLIFLLSLNLMLKRLAAMLPDETLRTETRAFTSVNSLVLILIPVLLILYSSISKVAGLPYTLRLLLDLAEPMSYWALIILVLLPTSITMSLVWKIKEAILASVFGQEH
jgi:hypothetical protein